MKKYTWFKNHEDKMSYTVVYTENDIKTIIAVADTADTADKADFICKACNYLTSLTYNLENS